MSLIQIKVGATPDNQATRGTLLNLLLECHQRIRRFSRLAFTIGARPELPAAEIQDAAAQCLRYFTEALPLHVRDEEDSLGLRVVGKSVAVDATMAQLRAQHFAHERRLTTLCAALWAVRESPKEVLLHKQLAAEASAFETDIEEHLRLEETELFPQLDGLLSSQEQDEIVNELRARREGGLKVAHSI